MEEMHTARYEERAWVSMLSPGTLSPNLHVFINTEALQSCTLGFYGDFIHRQALLNHWPLAIEPKLQSLYPTWRLWGWTETSNPLIT